MSHTRLFRPKVPSEYAILLQTNYLYLVCENVNDCSYCQLVLLEDEDAEVYIDDDNTVLGFLGYTWISEYEMYGYIDIHVNHLVINYTEYMKRLIASTKIQFTWRKYQEKKNAVQVIKKAWKNWKIKKDELWNLRCFIGVAYLAIQACKDTKHSI
jgi:hypothetical protein